MTDKEKECLQYLFLTDPTEDKNALKCRKGEYAPGTCEWILETEELQKWLRSTTNTECNENILWLSGNPGTGKSTMAMAIAENLPNQSAFVCGDKTLAYFFCDSSSEDRRTATAILRGLPIPADQTTPRADEIPASQVRGAETKKRKVIYIV